MTTWPQGELQRIAETEDLHIAPFLKDGKPVTGPINAGSSYLGSMLGARARAATVWAVPRHAAASHPAEVAQ
jgi:hypothetical protein